MSDPEPEPLIQRNNAPDLPHFGKHFVYYGPSGVLTFRIDTQSYTHDGLAMIGGMVIHAPRHTRPEWSKIAPESISRSS